MTKEFCDICGKEIDKDKDFEYKVKIKEKKYCFTDSWWYNMSVCECCKQAIVERSKQLRERSCPNDYSRGIDDFVSTLKLYDVCGRLHISTSLVKEIAIKLKETNE